MAQRTYNVYIQSIDRLIHSSRISHLRHWCGPTFGDNIASIMFYSEKDTREAIRILHENGVTIYQKRNNTFVPIESKIVEGLL